MPKLVRITTVPISLDKLLTGQPGYMRGHGFEVFMISSRGNDTASLEKRESSKFIPVEMTRIISPVRDFISLVKLIRVLYKLKPDIVHTHTPKAGLLGMMASWFARVPVRLHTVAGLPLMEATGIKRLLLEYIERLTCFCSTQVYPNSNKLKAFIIENNFCSTAKLKVIGGGSSNGIDTNYFNLTPGLTAEADALKAKHNIGGGDFVFIFVGRLVKDKGIEELIEAFSDLSKVTKKIKLLLVGPEESELDPVAVSTTNEIEHNPQIVYVGFRPDVRPYLAMSNALVFPSYREGFPNVPMQAGCFELPCIVTNINGCNEIIENEKNGLIIPAKDVMALKMAMLRLIEDKPLYVTLRGNARAMIIERYEQTFFWELLLKEYREQLNKHEIIS